ncbi:uncharacterized protein A1O5_01351 [Cladophialophora psammophila CBS 110553]|uniref:EthD domain-containing protein n=1 Tax=Cladophialophora psammophila CBS 110553 TaxID=1182543 RepID=W9X370_9EURO|nr:uncharacterized protein A1O5_01351 [Cladophialophora psammophila CBS 110553]EXJ74658.1 hypothetical protein A1O5_01351 [Cladophialophora psammophila CBS 110553]
MASSSASQSLLRGPAVLIIWGQVQTNSPRSERHMNEWWTNEHLPERLALPGFHRTRRYYHSSAVEDESRLEASREEGGARDESSHYLVTYEVSSLDALTSPEYMHALNNPTPGTQKYMRLMRDMQRSACRVLVSMSQQEFAGCKGGGVGGTLRHAVFQAPSTPEMRTKLKDWLRRDGWTFLQTTYPSLLAMHLLEHDEKASRSGSSTKSYDGVNFQNSNGASGADNNSTRWMLLFEFTEPLGAPFAYYHDECPDFDQGLVNHDVDVAEVQKQEYGLLVVMEE